MTPLSSDMLTTDEVRVLLGISQGTIHNHRFELGGDNSSGVWLFRREAVETWQGLREKDVLRRTEVQAAGVKAADLLRARLAGITTPTAPPDARISYREVQLVVAWMRAGAPMPEPDRTTEVPTTDAASVGAAASVEVASPTSDSAVAAARAVVPAGIQAVLDSTPGGWKGMLKCIKTGDPWAIPRPFWLTAQQCPDVVLPAGAFRARYRQAEVDPRTGRWRTTIYVEAHYSCDPETGYIAYHGTQFAGWDDGLFPYGSVPAQYELANRRCELAIRAWQQCWLGYRLGYLSALGLPLEVHADEIAAEPRDRLVLERRYHIDCMSPAELACWYLVTDPPYMPRTNVHQYTFGRPFFDPSGTLCTPVLRSAGWVAGPGEMPRPEPVTIVGYALGAWPEGQRVPWYEEQNRAFDSGAREWAVEIEIRHRRWPMRPKL